MSHRGKLKRYLLILEQLQQRPSLARIRTQLEDHGFNLSKRTLERDLGDLRDEFGVEAVYDRASNSYSLSAEQAVEVPGLIQLLERAQLLELVQHPEPSIQELHRHIRFEGLGQLLGIHHLAPLLRAIRERRTVRVLHRKFHGPAAKRILLKPHQLKESQGRWYVLGPSAEHSNPIALGLDRIQQVEVLGTRFKRNEADVAALYDHVIGVDTSPGKPERVLLRFHPSQAPYVNALPLHSSQEVLLDDAAGLTIALFVMVNFELRRIILGMGASVQVLEPEHLAHTIQQAHQEASALYRK